jgi:UDP-GlcNAc3NAcA epimerase
MQMGDVMQDAAILFTEKASAPKDDVPEQFILATLHRAENTDNPERLVNIGNALNNVHETVMPVKSL